MKTFKRVVDVLKADLATGKSVKFDRCQRKQEKSGFAGNLQGRSFLVIGQNWTQPA